MFCDCLALILLPSFPFPIILLPFLFFRIKRRQPVEDLTKRTNITNKTKAKNTLTRAFALSTPFFFFFVFSSLRVRICLFLFFSVLFTLDLTGFLLVVVINAHFYFFFSFLFFVRGGMGSHFLLSFAVFRFSFISSDRRERFCGRAARSSSRSPSSPSRSPPFSSSFRRCRGVRERG